MFYSIVGEVSYQQVLYRQKTNQTEILSYDLYKKKLMSNIFLIYRMRTIMFFRVLKLHLDCMEPAGMIPLDICPFLGLSVHSGRVSCGRGQPHRNQRPYY